MTVAEPVMLARAEVVMRTTARMNGQRMSQGYHATGAHCAPGCHDRLGRRANVRCWGAVSKGRRNTLS
jgi:hypothetical protein